MNPSSKQKSLFVGSIPLNTPESEVRQIFSKFGRVIDTTFKAPKKGRDSFSCILEMQTRDQCFEILDSQPFYLNGSRLSVGFYLYKSEVRKKKFESGKRMVYICNIPIGMSEEDLEDLLRREGVTVEKCLLNKKGDYESPMENYGFVVLGSEDEVNWLLGKGSFGVKFSGQKSTILIKEFVQKLSLKKKSKKMKKMKNFQKNKEKFQLEKNFKIIEESGNKELLSQIDGFQEIQDKHNAESFASASNNKNYQFSEGCRNRHFEHNYYKEKSRVEASYVFTAIKQRGKGASNEVFSSNKKSESGNKRHLNSSRRFEEGRTGCYSPEFTLRGPLNPYGGRKGDSDRFAKNSQNSTREGREDPPTDRLYRLGLPYRYSRASNLSEIQKKHIQSKQFSEAANRPDSYEEVSQRRSESNFKPSRITRELFEEEFKFDGSCTFRQEITFEDEYENYHYQGRRFNKGFEVPEVPIWRQESQNPRKKQISTFKISGQKGQKEPYWRSKRQFKISAYKVWKPSAIRQSEYPHDLVRGLNHRAGNLAFRF